MKQHHQSNQSQLQDPVQEKIQDVNLQQIRHPRQQKKKHHRLGNPSRATAANQLDSLIHQKGHQCNIYHIRQLHRPQEAKKLIQIFKQCLHL